MKKKKKYYLAKFKENNNYFNNLNKMIENWNNFRDIENELRGDLSIYYNYKEEIEMRRQDLIYLNSKEI